ncbi:hypothetical protein N9948_01095 [bacterium]|nr:hypothetical protein [bacterium]
MRYIIAELDRIAKNLEEFGEPWVHNLVFRIDNVTQKIEDNYNREKNFEKNKMANISKNVLDQYREDLEFLSNKESKLSEMIKSQNSKNASKVYTKIKEHFGKLDKKESIRFIKNIIKNM